MPQSGTRIHSQARGGRWWESSFRWATHQGGSAATRKWCRQPPFRTLWLAGADR